MFLRNIRYVIANDLSETAVEAMKRNIELNGLGPEIIASSEGLDKPSASDFTSREKVRVNHGDARYVLAISCRSDD